MTPREQITAAIRAANDRDEPALVAFLTAGYPSRERFREHLTAIASSADVVEIGVPFSDPTADGLTIQRSSRIALEQGVNLKWILSELEAMPRVKAPLLLMSYMNPLLNFGFDRLPEAAVRAGVAGFIVPDLPLDESDEMREALDTQGLALIQMVTRVTEPERLKMVCAAGSGFLYAVTMTGTTGNTVNVPPDVIEYLDNVRAHSPVPVCAGFGIRSSEQVRRLKGHVDGVIVGSALVEKLEQGEDVAKWLRTLRLS